MESSAQTESSIRKLYMAANYYCDISPKLSAFYMSQAENAVDRMDMPRTPPSVACQYCGAVFRAGNHTTRLEPRLKLNKKLRKLMTRQQSGEKLGRFQQKVVTMYIASNNRVLRTCLVCNMTSVIKCKTSSKRSSRAPCRAPSRASSRVPSHLSLSSIPSDSSVSSVTPKKLSKKQQRKLRKQQERQQQQQQQQPLNDSGLDVSITSSFLSTSGSTGSRSLSQSSIQGTPIGRTKPKFTSTPIVEPGRIKHVASESFSHTVVASSAPAIKITALTNPLQNKSKKGKKDKKGILQKMLMQEKRDRVNPERSSTLAAFLSSL